MTDIDQDELVSLLSGLYRSQSYYGSSSATGNVFSDTLAAGSSSSTYNGNDNSSVATATQVDDSPASNEECNDDRSCDCSSDSDGGSSCDSGSSSDSGSSDSGSFN